MRNRIRAIGSALFLLLATTFIIASTNSRIDAEATQSPPTADETTDAKQRQLRDERIRKLERMVETFKSEIRARDAQIKLLVESRGVGTTEIDEQIQLRKRQIELDRELLIQDIQESAKRFREARAESALRQELKGENDPATLEARSIAKVTEKQLNEAKEALRVFDDNASGRLFKLIQERVKQQTSMNERDALLKEVEPMRVALTQLETQLLSLRADIDLPMPIGIDSKLDKLIHEVETLRKEVQELKKK